MRPGQGIAGAQSGIAVPVMIHGTVLGTLGCWALRPSAFSIDDERLLEMLATQIAAAITAATSREDSERLARIDSLTGLPNRLQLSEDEASVERTAADQGLAVLMIDIDWFKRVNDVYGHLLGDRVLRQVGTILRQVLRSTDHVYRFGGEEFLVIAACSSETESLALAERLRVAVDKSVILRRADETGIHVTVSVGVTMLKRPTHTLVEAIDMADQALYAAKSKGRNQSALWDAETSQTAAA